MILTINAKNVQWFDQVIVRKDGVVLIKDDDEYFVPDLTYILKLFPYNIKFFEGAIEFSIARAIADPSLVGCQSTTEVKRASSANITMIVDGVYTLSAPIREFKKIIQAIPPDTPIQLPASEFERLLNSAAS